MTIFGEEHFLDDKMCEIAHERAKEIDKHILDNIYKSSLEIGVRVDKDKLRHWLILCGQLENIDKTALIDIAVQRKFAEKDHRIADLQEQNKKLKRALKLACGKADDIITTIYRNDCCCDLDMPSADYFINQAEKELKGE